MMTAAQSPTQSSPRDVFAKLMQAVLAYDMDGQADLYAEDGVLEWPFAPAGMPRRVEGREAIRRLLVPLGEQARESGRQMRRYDGVVMHETADPDEIVIEFNVEGETASGRPYRLPFIQVLRTRNGEIASLRDYWNPIELPTLVGRKVAREGWTLGSSVCRSSSTVRRAHVTIPKG